MSYTIVSSAGDLANIKYAIILMSDNYYFSIAKCSSWLSYAIFDNIIIDIAKKSRTKNDKNAAINERSLCQQKLGTLVFIFLFDMFCDLT